MSTYAPTKRRSCISYLEGHPRLDLLPQNRRDALVEVGHDAHGKLRLDSAGGDQVVEGVSEGESNSVVVSEISMCLKR